MNCSLIIPNLMLPMYKVAALTFSSNSGYQPLMIYFVIRSVSMFFIAMLFPVYIAEILDYFSHHSKDENAKRKKWGEIRVYGALGWGVANMLIGLLIDITGTTTTIVYFGLAFAIPSVIVVNWTFDAIAVMDAANPRVCEESKALKPKTGDSAMPFGPVKGPFETFFSVFCGNVESAVFLAIMFLSHIGMVLVENLVFLYFVDDLKLSYFLCGVSVVVTVAFELPLFHYSDKLLKLFGYDWLIVIGLVTYSVRVMIYTLIPEEHKSWILSVEWMHGVTIATIGVAATLKVSDVAPDGLETTFQGTVTGITGAGSFLGEVLGGYGFEKIGKPWTYRVASILVLFTAVVYFLNFSLKQYFSPGIKYTSLERGEERNDDMAADQANIELKDVRTDRMELE